ncbi:jg2828 [Pararge aegeria aegeria]|uniref:Jg2828 protein n=1 Tax=Pararge aegeria aegeria TaxID=348720 RepID=A0A8S4QL68_9NEOP|nr:jg2828 [Pararge aegeria aegeria]
MGYEARLVARGGDRLTLAQTLLSSALDPARCSVIVNSDIERNKITRGGEAISGVSSGQPARRQGGEAAGREAARPLGLVMNV